MQTSGWSSDRFGEERQRGQPDQERVGSRAFAQSEDRLERGALRDGKPFKVIEHRHAELMQAAVGELHLGLNARRLGDTGARRLRAVAQVAEERGFADASLASEHEDSAGASDRIGQEPVERLTLNPTTQESHDRPAPSRAGALSARPYT